MTVSHASSSLAGPLTNALGSWLDIHAFLAWFDISFECTHKKVKFSTGPHAQYTHWKSVHWVLSFCVLPDLQILGKLYSTPPTP